MTKTTDELAARRGASQVRAVDRARARAEQSGADLRSTILDAVAAGATHADVARAAGLSRARVSQIVAEDRPPA